MRSKLTDILGTRRRNIQRPRVHTEVLTCLLEDIQSGIYQEGQKLPSERELMEEFGVGRPAVREALSALGRMGLVELSPGMRARVCKLTLRPLLEEMRATLQIYSSSPDGWRQLHDLRLFFETSVARQLAHSITDAQLGQLEEVLESQRHFLEHSEIRSFAEADIAFHRLLVEFLGNPFLGLLAEGFAGWLITPLYASMQVRRQSERSCTAHQAVFEALTRRDPDGAEQAMRLHLEEMRAIYQVDPMVETQWDNALFAHAPKNGADLAFPAMKSSRGAAAATAITPEKISG
ncbi:FCD domain-containing protein [Desulfovibrio sp. ZJ369]|uniref:FCD domain-containing protein n=1 Tax=Desulfovibrio sp. ZJ369 TaxID=2709793 RepID=UPI0013EB2F93|nr:FCD domain-containing protein [Desulfovibrio sp. ZJ369]